MTAPFPELHAFMMAAVGEGISGGDRIGFEFLRWARARGVDATAYVWRDGSAMMDRAGLARFPRVSWPGGAWGRGLAGYLARSVIARRRARDVRPAAGAAVYSASDFWPDVFPAVAVKRRHPRARWIAGLYLRADGARGWRARLRASSQRRALAAMRGHADLVLVLNERDRDALVREGFTERRVLAIRGGVDLRLVDAVPDLPRRYDACFVGRFHPQKGLPDLLAAWDAIRASRPGTRLALVGSGSPAWESRVSAWLADPRRGDSIDRLGHRDGADKFAIMKSARLLLLPSQEESYGLVVAEALACGTPVVAYDLPALGEAFPQGVTFVPRGGAQALAAEAVRLLGDEPARQRLAAAARALGQRLDWDAAFAAVERRLSELGSR